MQFTNKIKIHIHKRLCVRVCACLFYPPCTPSLPSLSRSLSLSLFTSFCPPLPTEFSLNSKYFICLTSSLFYCHQQIQEIRIFTNSKSEPHHHHTHTPPHECRQTHTPTHTTTTHTPLIPYIDLVKTESYPPEPGSSLRFLHSKDQFLHQMLRHAGMLDLNK